MYIKPFAVEIWMNAWENRCEFNLAETCVQSLTIAELLQICGMDESELSALLPMKMTYGEITGSPRLRAAVASLYEKQTADNVMITHGTIGANALVLQAQVVFLLKTHRTRSRLQIPLPSVHYYRDNTPRKPSVSHDLFTDT